MEYNLVILKIEEREKSAPQIQEILTDFGCYIKIRLGLHDVPSDSCSPSGLIIMEVVAKKEEIEEFVNILNGFSGVTAKSLTI